MNEQTLQDRVALVTGGSGDIGSATCRRLAAAGARVVVNYRSSKASAETQMPIFIRFVEMKRGEMAGWLTELAEIVLALLAVTEPGVIAEQSPTLQWDSLDQQDGKLTLETVAWAYAEGLLDDTVAERSIQCRTRDRIQARVACDRVVHRHALVPVKRRNSDVCPAESCLGIF